LEIENCILMLQMNKRIGPLVEYIAESTTACLVTMVQGNLLVLTFSHLLIASQTGVVAGAVASVAIFLSRNNKRWIISLVLGIATAVIDYFIHPGMFGPIAMEAIVTGVAAAALSYLVGTTLRMARGKSVSAR
jgi:hypothetical protein